MATTKQFGSKAEKCTVCSESVYPTEAMALEGNTIHKTCFKCTHCARQLTLANFAMVSGKVYCKPHFVKIFRESGGKYTAFDKNEGTNEQGSFLSVDEASSQLNVSAATSTTESPAKSARLAAPADTSRLSNAPSEDLNSSKLSVSSNSGAVAKAISARESSAPKATSAAVPPPAASAPSTTASTANKFAAKAERCTVCKESVYPTEAMALEGNTIHKNCFKCAECKRQLSLSNFASINGTVYCKPHFMKRFRESGGKYSAFDNPAAASGNSAGGDDEDDLAAVSVERQNSTASAQSQSAAIGIDEGSSRGGMLLKQGSATSMQSQSSAVVDDASASSSSRSGMFLKQGSDISMALPSSKDSSEFDNAFGSARTMARQVSEQSNISMALPPGGAGPKRQVSGDSVTSESARVGVFERQGSSATASSISAPVSPMVGSQRVAQMTENWEKASATSTPSPLKAAGAPQLFSGGSTRVAEAQKIFSGAAAANTPPPSSTTKPLPDLAAGELPRVSAIAEKFASKEAFESPVQSREKEVVPSPSVKVADLTQKWAEKSSAPSTTSVAAPAAAAIASSSPVVTGAESVSALKQKFSSTSSGGESSPAKMAKEQPLTAPDKVSDLTQKWESGAINAQQQQQQQPSSSLAAPEVSPEKVSEMAKLWGTKGTTTSSPALPKSSLASPARAHPRGAVTSSSDSTTEHHVTMASDRHSPIMSSAAADGSNNASTPQKPTTVKLNPRPTFVFETKPKSILRRPMSAQGLVGHQEQAVEAVSSIFLQDDKRIMKRSPSGREVQFARTESGRELMLRKTSSGRQFARTESGRELLLLRTHSGREFLADGTSTDHRHDGDSEDDDEDEEEDVQTYVDAAAAAAAASEASSTSQPPSVPSITQPFISPALRRRRLSDPASRLSESLRSVGVPNRDTLRAYKPRGRVVSSGADDVQVNWSKGSVTNRLRWLETLSQAKGGGKGVERLSELVKRTKESPLGAPVRGVSPPSNKLDLASSSSAEQQRSVSPIVVDETAASASFKSPSVAERAKLFAEETDISTTNEVLPVIVVPVAPASNSDAGSTGTAPSLIDVEGHAATPDTPGTSATSTEGGLIFEGGEASSLLRQAQSSDDGAAAAADKSSEGDASGSVGIMKRTPFKRVKPERRSVNFSVAEIHEIVREEDDGSGGAEEEEANADDDGMVKTHRGVAARKGSAMAAYLLATEVIKSSPPSSPVSTPLDNAGLKSPIRAAAHVGSKMDVPPMDDQPPAPLASPMHAGDVSSFAPLLGGVKRTQADAEIEDAGTSTTAGERGGSVSSIDDVARLERTGSDPLLEKLEDRAKIPAGKRSSPDPGRKFRALSAEALGVVVEPDLPGAPPPPAPPATSGGDDAPQ